MTENATLPEPGLHPGVPMAEYRGWKAANKSTLWMARKRSWAHALHALSHDWATDAMRVGSLTHTCVLEHDRWVADYVRGPDGPLNRNPARAEWAELVELHGDFAVRAKEYDAAMAMREAVAAHPKARALIEGQAEASALWIDPETGVFCKGRFDLISSRSPTIVDLKKCRDASRGAMERVIYDLGYHVQAAHYLQGGQEVLPTPPEHFALVCVEPEPPYGVAVYRIDDATLLAGAEELRVLLRQWRRCEESGEWPGYDGRVRPIDMPEWAIKRSEQYVEIMGGGE